MSESSYASNIGPLEFFKLLDITDVVRVPDLAAIVKMWNDHRLPQLKHQGW
jgi:hypothetical protein